MEEDDESEDDNALFEEEGLVELDSDTPPHLRALATASEVGRPRPPSRSASNLESSNDQPVEAGDTAHHLACLYGHLPCVQLLLERGANLVAEDEDGALPLYDACAGVRR